MILISPRTELCIESMISLRKLINEAGVYSHRKFYMDCFFISLQSKLEIAYERDFEG